MNSGFTDARQWLARWCHDSAMPISISASVRAPENKVNLPAEVLADLSHPAHRRSELAAASEAVRSLSVPVSATLAEFYARYEGPFHSRATGIMLLDIISGNPSVRSHTLACRAMYGFGLNHIVLTDLLANSVLVLESNTDRIFDVDFEGGDRMFLQGLLPSSWPSFEAFLYEYFGPAPP